MQKRTHRSKVEKTAAGHDGSHSKGSGDPEAVSSWLNEFGGPRLTVEDLSRLTHGPLGEILAFIVTHVRGRHEVAAARRHIHQERSSGQGKTGLSTQRTCLDKATSRHWSAKTNLNIRTKNVDKRLKAIAASQSELEQLKSVLNRKRQVVLSLRVLESKETVRLARIRQLASMLRTLEYNRSNECDKELWHHLCSTEFKPWQPSARTRMTTQFQGALSNLHAYHIRLSRIVAASPTCDEARLRKSIAKRLGVNEDNERVTRLLEKHVSAARTRAKAQVAYRSITSPLARDNPESELTRLVQLNRKQTDELQRALDLSVALAFAVKGLFNTISEFLANAPLLKLYLEEEASQAKGYIDVLRAQITDVLFTRNAKSSFRADVIDSLGLSRNTTTESIENELQHRLRRVKLREDFLRQSQVERPPCITSDQEQMIARSEAHRDATHAHVTKLLTRKIEKSDLASGLVRNIETVVKEANVIVALGREARI